VANLLNTKTRSSPPAEQAADGVTGALSILCCAIGGVLRLIDLRWHRRRSVLKRAALIAWTGLLGIR